MAEPGISRGLNIHLVKRVKDKGAEGEGKCRERKEIWGVKKGYWGNDRA